MVFVDMAATSAMAQAFTGKPSSDVRTVGDNEKTLVAGRRRVPGCLLDSRMRVDLDDRNCTRSNRDYFQNPDAPQTFKML